MFKFSNPRQFEQLVEALFLKNNIDPLHLTHTLALSWDQANQLANDPLVTISAHTINHYVLKQLTDAEAKYEISESKRILETRLGKVVDFFAYPYGSHWEAGRREFQLVSESGYKMALSTRYGNLFPAHQKSLMNLPRYDMSRTPHTDQLNMLSSGIFAMRVNHFRRIAEE